MPVLSSNPLLKPVAPWCAEEGFSIDTGYALFDEGEVVMVGGRRMIVLASPADYVGRRTRGVERDPLERAAAAAAYRASIDRTRIDRMTHARGRKQAAAQRPATAPQQQESGTTHRIISDGVVEPANLAAVRRTLEGSNRAEMTDTSPRPAPKRVLRRRPVPGGERPAPAPKK